ncbi:MAG: hypothetical protein E5W57_04085 [Mesorhizobium sp.]|nr:MAG: hypothetical protein E5W57_04085 [Mesorhizobium sp.]
MGKYKLVPQIYGIATAGNTFGGPRGIWLECRATGCNASDRIVGRGAANLSDKEAAAVFRAHGWSALTQGDRMYNARCPACTQKLAEAAA